MIADMADFAASKPVERVFLVGVCSAETSRDSFNETMEELRHLASTAGVEVADVFVQSLEKPQVATYIGKGKLQEITNRAKTDHIRTLIFNNDLSPSQSRNLSDLTHCNVVDRTEIILDIFAQHAHTRQAKLQVEMAQLEYSYTKLKRKWKHLSRIEGGIGFRGPGETQIEIDRREIRKRIALLKKKLEEIKQTSLVNRQKRKYITSLSLVGYTNAGKSTLFNQITREQRYTADQLFATLDALTRAMQLPGGEKVILTDTIGFIRELPLKLVSSFHSTLLEVVEADLLLHVVDINHHDLHQYIESVNNVLKEIHVDDKNILMVFNKCDRMTGHYFTFLKKKLVEEFPDSVFISALQGRGLEKLIDKIEEFLRKSKVETALEIPLGMSNLVTFLYENAEVSVADFDEVNKLYRFQVKIPRKLIGGIRKQIEEYNFKQYINK